MKVRENNRPERDSNSRPLTLYVSALPTELSGHASKSLPIGRSFARTAPLLTNLHRGAIAAPSQCALDLQLREDCLHQGGHRTPIDWIEFHFFQILLPLQNFPQLYPVDGAAMAPPGVSNPLSTAGPMHIYTMYVNIIFVHIIYITICIIYVYIISTKVFAIARKEAPFFVSKNGAVFSCCSEVL